MSGVECTRDHHEASSSSVLGELSRSEVVGRRQGRVVSDSFGVSAEEEGVEEDIQVCLARSLRSLVDESCLTRTLRSLVDESLE